MPTERRQFVVGIVGLVSVSVAGCLGQDTEDAVRCQTEGPDTETKVFQDATVRPKGDGAILEIVFLDEDASESGAARVSIYEGESLRHRIPVDTHQRYNIRVGTLPFHGVYRIVAEDPEGTEIEEMEIKFNCFSGE